MPTPLKSMSSSVGMILSNLCKIIQMFQTTNHINYISNESNRIQSFFLSISVRHIKYYQILLSYTNKWRWSLKSPAGYLMIQNAGFGPIQVSNEGASHPHVLSWTISLFTPLYCKGTTDKVKGWARSTQAIPQRVHKCYVWWFVDFLRGVSLFTLLVRQTHVTYSFPVVI